MINNYLYIYNNVVVLADVVGFCVSVSSLIFLEWKASVYFGCRVKVRMAVYIHRVFFTVLHMQKIMKVLEYTTGGNQSAVYHAKATPHQMFMTACKIF